MSKTFDAVGFSVTTDEGYHQLTEQVGELGSRSTIFRRGAKLHGCCFKLGNGLEIWTVVYENDHHLYYANCRPAFRPLHITKIGPWELTEYDEDGEAILRGLLNKSQQEICFALQNLTELSSSLFQRHSLSVALAGLAIRAHLCSRQLSGRFSPLKPTNHAAYFAGNEYSIRGRIISLRKITNPLTARDLYWLYLDTDLLQIEIILNANLLADEPKIGMIISAHIWLQGYVFDDEALAARYEGVDPQFQMVESWSKLRRFN